jgi:hypothetical protein
MRKIVLFPFTVPLGHCLVGQSIALKVPEGVDPQDFNGSNSHVLNSGAYRTLHGATDEIRINCGPGASEDDAPQLLLENNSGLIWAEGTPMWLEAGTATEDEKMAYAAALKVRRLAEDTEAAPASVDPLDHDGDGRKGGSKRKATPAATSKA